MLKWFGRNKGQGGDTPLAALVPNGQRIYAVGDIHGCHQQLLALLQQIIDDATGYNGNVTLVFLGDYINRGPASAQVLQTLCVKPWPSKWQVVCLRGNHEQALLDFMKNPTRMPDWLYWGGIETLASYHIQIQHQGRPRGPESLAAELNDMLNEQGHLNFLKATQLTYQRDSNLFVHAGVRPNVPLARQLPSDLLFIRDDFIGRPHGLPYRVVFGHTIQPTPLMENDRIGLDTGAYKGGPLTAVKLEDIHVTFLQQEA